MHQPPSLLQQSQQSSTAINSNNVAVAPSLVSQVATSESTNGAPPSSGTCTIHLSPVLGVAPLGRHALTQDHSLQLQLLEAAYQHIPHPSDSERLR